MNTNKYIERIGFEGKLEASEACLKALHRCQVMSVPFEAIDVQLGIRINLDLDQIFQKVVLDRRGGYCYELNYLFHWLLQQVGFETDMVSARVFDEGKFGPEYDHMALGVYCESSWLVDVGYGDLFIEPIMMTPDLIQEDDFKFYKLEIHSTTEFLLLESLKANIKWMKSYSFGTDSKTIDDFEEQNEYKQSSSESHFVKNRICTLATTDGRKTIRNNTFKVRANNNGHQKEILNQEEMDRILEDEFGIKI